MALKATLEPMLIKERRVVTRSEIITEFRGIFQPGLTCRNEMSSADVGEIDESLRMKGKGRMACHRLERRRRAGEMRWLRC